MIDKPANLDGWMISRFEGRPSMGPPPHPLTHPPLHHRRCRLHQANKTAAPLRYISHQVHGGAGSISALLVISPQWQLRRKSASSALGTGECPRSCTGSIGPPKAGNSGVRRGHSQRGLPLLASLASRCKRRANTCSTGRTSSSPSVKCKPISRG